MEQGEAGPGRRRVTRQVQVGQVPVGGDAPVSVQSMTKTDTRDAAATLAQIEEVATAGCDIVRVAVPDRTAAAALGDICRGSRLPVVADIHFDYRLALAALDQGVHKLRVNPGNIGGRDRVLAVARAAQGRRVPIRVGVNAGSLEPDLLARHGAPTAAALVSSALRHVQMLEEVGFGDIVVSLKAFDLPTAVAAYREMSRLRDYPLHVGITESGSALAGSVRSAVGIGTLLGEGIGDTIRVSLTGSPVEEVKVGHEILKALGLRSAGPVFVSCPTCGRCEIDLLGIEAELREGLADVRTPIRVAIMGCVVNGPGEARLADFGLAGGRGAGIIFRHGQVVRRVAEANMVSELLQVIRAALADETDPSPRPAGAPSHAAQ